MNDDEFGFSNQSHADSLFNLIIEMQMNKRDLYERHGEHQFADILNCINSGKDNQSFITDDDTDAFTQRAVDNMQAYDLLELVSSDELHEIRRQLVQYDKSMNNVSSYTSKSAEFIFMNILQSYFENDTEESNWIISCKVSRAATLLTEINHYNDGKMGLFIESASILDSLTGNGTDGTNEFFIKMREKLPIRILNATIKFSENMYSLLSGANFSDHADLINTDFEKPGTVIPRRYHPRDMVMISGGHDPYASIQEQKKIIPHIRELADNFNALERYKRFGDFFGQSAAILENNCKINSGRPVSRMRMIPN